MALVNIYLTFNGNCEAAFNFYKSAFGGEFAFMGRFGDMPPQDGVVLTEEDKNRIMHVSLPISNETILMASDTTAQSNQQHGEIVAGNNFAISINAGSREEADRLFNALSSGGRITMPLNETFWGAYFGMFTDQFGINWMMNYDEKPAEA